MTALPHVAELLAVGETMLAFAPVDGAIDEARRYRAIVAGGESNVAVHVASHGHSAAWASRLGDDAAGRRILAELNQRGVDTSLVQLDTAAPTGVMLKDPGVNGSSVRYYRTGSAASAMDRGWLGEAALAGVRVLHVTGVTPALSAGCAAMVDDLFDRAAAARVLRSFDVNHRPALWSSTHRSAADELEALARRADVCFVGADEARDLWGDATPQSVRERISEPSMLIVKDGAEGATAFLGDGTVTFEPALEVDVVEPVGAGDAFAGGFLAGVLQRDHVRACLRQGHATAARVLVTVDDLPEMKGRS